MVRRIRVASNSPLVDVIKEHGYHVEHARRFDGTEDHTTVVASFPFSHPDGTVIASSLSAVNQLEFVRRLQREWSDNAVSCTVYYRLEELDEIKEYLSVHYNKHFKSVSFLLHNEHGFSQAPLEEISKEEYEKLVKKTRLITSVHDAQFESDDECASGVCPVR